MSRGGASLRVGLVCPYSFDTPGGVQNHVLGLARYLDDQGHEPHILAPGDFPPDGSADPPRSLTDVNLDRQRFTSAGAAVAVRYNGSTARVNFGPLSAARVRRWLRHGDFDVLHIHEPITPSISVLALWAADVPVVATFHTATPRSRSMQLAGGAMRAAVEKIDAGIAVSESARKVVVQHLGRDAVVIPNGFRYADFAPDPRSLPFRAGSRGGATQSNRRWRTGAHPRVSFLGRLDEPRKGLDTLLDAVPELVSSFPGVDVVIAGQGNRPLPVGCRSIGVVTDRDKAELLATSDVFVAPHLARESFGLVLLEAMASGAAVVASDLDAFADLLAGAPGTRPDLGTTFTAGDPAALAAAVRGALERPDAVRLAAAAGASRSYDWSVVGSAISDVYRATRDMTRPLGRSVRR